MPYIVQGEPSSWTDNDFGRVDHKYEYPYDLDLKPDSDFHIKIRSKIWERARAARNEISKRFDSWNEIDRTLTTYIPLKDREKQLKGKDTTKPVSIVFPYSYSNLEALLTYLALAFFQDPVFQYEGVEDSDTIGAMLMELVIRLHCIKTKVPLSIHTILRDNLSYGVGIGLPEWVTRWGKRPVKATISTLSELGRSTDNYVEFVDDMIFEGNALSSVDPYMWLPDPSVSSANVQDGEFFGWLDRDNYMNLLNEEAQRDSGLFNVRYLKSVQNKRSSLSQDQSERQTRYGGSTELHRSMSGTVHPVDVIRLYVNLIPSEWGLSESDEPEKWFFALASDDVVIACERADHSHGMYPAAVASSEFDGYSITPIGRMEVLYGLQGVLDFLFNSHVTNVRKAINDMLVVDPYLVNIKDLEDPEPGKLIRLRRPAWGRGVDKVVQQLQVHDITQANIADSTYITQWMDRISGADQSMQGALRQGGPERLTGTEFRGTRGSAISRLQRVAMILGMQFMQDIGEMFAAHTQQYMSRETYVRIIGRYQEQLKKMFGKGRAKVTPYDLAINYDLIVRDGSIPGGNFSEAWIQLWQIIATTPELQQEFDTFRIFTYIASQLGAKNIEDFKRNAERIETKTIPDEEALREAEKGNIVPIGA